MTADRVWVFAEGPGDHGPTDRDQIGQWGVLQILVQRVLEREDVTFTGIARGRLLALGRAPPASVKGALARKARQATLLASSDGCRAIVLHADTDEAAKVGKPQKAPAALATTRSTLADGVAAAGVDVAPIYAVPVATIEAWLVADHDALKGSADDALSKWPETLWGVPHDAHADHPKMVFRRVTDDSQTTRQAIAQSVDVATLEARCPLSFVPFAQDVRAALS